MGRFLRNTTIALSLAPDLSSLKHFQSRAPRFCNSKRDTMEIHGVQVLLEPDDEAGGYVVTCPALPGCYTQGDTIDEAIANIREVILLCLEDLQSK